MNITIDKVFQGPCPKIRLGVILYKTHVRQKNDDLWEYMNKTTFPAVLKKLDATPLSEFDNLRESRAAYRALGNDPTRHRVSSEALIRRIKNGKGLYQVNSVVDINNLVSIESGFSVGSYDLSAINGDIVLRIGFEGETYEGIGKSSVNIARSPVLADGTSAFGGTTSDSARTMVTLQSTDILTVIYSFSENKDLEVYSSKACGWLERFASVEISASRLVSL